MADLVGQMAEAYRKRSAQCQKKFTIAVLVGLNVGGGLVALALRANVGAKPSSRDGLLQSK
jgi:hypothetical protein